uniref:hypothetical protein n=2 Tax=unclassified Synechococcus TaxID=2626047 RepID=UPI000E0ED210|nr:hypothetical protein [Synechococcus sp. UW106]
MVALDQRYFEGISWWIVMSTRYVLRTGEIILSNRNPEGLDVYCYRTGYNHHTCLLLSEQSEADFLLRYGSEELNVAYPG